MKPWSWKFMPVSRRFSHRERRRRRNVSRDGGVDVGAAVDQQGQSVQYVGRQGQGTAGLLGAVHDAGVQGDAAHQARHDRLLSHDGQSPQDQGPDRRQVHPGAARRRGEGQGADQPPGALHVPRHPRHPLQFDTLRRPQTDVSRYLSHPQLIVSYLTGARLTRAMLFFLLTDSGAVDWRGKRKAVYHFFRKASIKPSSLCNWCNIILEIFKNSGPWWP